MEKDLAETLREDLLIPISKASRDVRSFTRVSIDHLQDQRHYTLVFNPFLKLVLRVEGATSVLLQTSQVEQGQPIHQDLSDDAPCREDIHLVRESGVAVKVISRRAPPFGRHVAPNIVIKVTKEFIIAI